MNNNGQHTIATNAPFSLARRTTTDRPAARSRSPSSPPAHPSAWGRGLSEAGRAMRAGERGSGGGWKMGGGDGSVLPSSFISSSSLRIVVVSSRLRRRLICYLVPSWLVSSFHPSSVACAVSICSSLFVSSSFRHPLVSSSSRFACRSVFRPAVVPFPALSSYPSSSCRIVRRFACSSLIVLPRRSVVVPPRRLVPHPSARPHSPFIDTGGRGVFLIR